MTSESKTPLLRLWITRYWRTWLVYLWMRCTAKLPYSAQLAIGRRIGKFIHVILPKRRRVAQRNLELCFPDLSAVDLKSLLKRHFEAVGAATAEMSMAWFGCNQVIHQLVHVEGSAHLTKALQKGNGVILFSGHFTTFEFFFPVLKTFCPWLCAMYKPQRSPLMDKIMRRGRSQSIDELLPKTRVRAMLKCLSNNAVVWYASDQSYHRTQSELVPFFNQPAMTNTAISRIAKTSGAVVLPYFCRRLDDDSGYVMNIGTPLENFPSDNAIEDTRRLTALLEEYIQLCPEQYFWIHRRFKGRPEPYPNPYQP